MLTAALFRPAYGCFPRWPEEGTSWIHPDDVDTALALIPSDRIFRREWSGGEYSRLVYGQQVIRAKPTMWQIVEPGRFHVGDEVEIRSQMGKRLPGLAIVREALWNPHAGAVQYELEQREMILPLLFEDHDLAPVEFLHDSELLDTSANKAQRRPTPLSDAETPELLP